MSRRRPPDSREWLQVESGKVQRRAQEHMPLSGSSLNMRNFESMVKWGVTVDDAGRALSAAFGRPRREVVEDPAGFRIAGTDFVTVDRALAEAVAAEYDRIDPTAPPRYLIGDNGPEEMST